MAYRINHIHLKSPDPRKTADWYAKAFNFKILSDEMRAFGDRFIRCQSEDGGMMVNISGARTGETLGAGRRHAAPRPRALRLRLGATWTRTSRDWRASGRDLLEGPIQVPNGARIAFVRAPTTAGSSWSSARRRSRAVRR